MRSDERDLEIVLGTAMWGWTIEQERAFAIADRFYERGGRWFDTASNYPINKNPDAFGLAESWLGEWILSRGHADVAVAAKIGAVSNDGSPTADLRSKRLRCVLGKTQDRLGGSVRLVSLHWDNRDDPAAIADTLGFMHEVHGDGLRIGLSGIRHPRLYADQAPDLRTAWCIQIKHNALTQAAYADYAPFHGKATFFAYGLNAGGLSLGEKAGEGRTARVRAASASDGMRDAERTIAALQGRERGPRSLNELSILVARANPDIGAILVGASRPAHVDGAFDYVAGLTRRTARDLLDG